MSSRIGTPSRRWSARAPACGSSPRGGTSRSRPCGSTSRPTASPWSGSTRSSRTWRTSSCRSSIASARRACASSSERSNPGGVDVGSRLHGIIAKEFLQLWRDRLALTLMLFVTVAMLFIFAWAINTHVNDAPPLDVRVRAWYNPDLVSAIFIVPGLIGALLMQTTVSVMAIAIVRERERGTLEALVVSPIRRWELLLGKIIPNLLVAYGQMTMALLVAHFVFEVPIRGSLALLYGLSAVFMWGTLGIGILVSAASRTVPQAMQLSFMTFLPSIYLSGLLFPIEGMPQGAQYIASIIPLTYYLRIVRGIVLKGIGVEYLWPSVLPLVAFGAVVFSLSVLRFRKQLD